MIESDGKAVDSYSLSLLLGDVPGLENADASEPNNLRGSATRLTADDLTLDGTIHSAFDLDYYRWLAPTDGVLQASLEFNSMDGNLDLFVYSATGVLLGWSSSDEGTENIVVNVEGQQRLYVKVSGRGAPGSIAYRLDLSPAPP